MTDTRRTQIRRALLSTALALLLLSLILPAVSHIQHVDCFLPSWEVGLGYFLFGPLGIITAQYGWFANPLMLFAALRNSRFSAVIAVALIVLTAFTLTSEPNDNGGRIVCGFGPGYYLWLACSVLVLITTFIRSAQPTGRASPTTLADQVRDDIS